jgi:Ca-activated chloride channel family protein
LLVYVDDMALPRARIRLADLARLGGGRPLNLRKVPGQAVRIVLSDPGGAWASAAPEITVRLTVG